MEPGMSAQGSRAPGPATGLPSYLTASQSQGNGVVVEWPLLSPPSLCWRVRERLDAHVLQKRRQLLQGLPPLIQSSLERSVPSLLGFLEGPLLQDTTDPPRSLLEAEAWQCLDQRLKQEMIHHKGVLPRRTEKTIQMPLAPGPAVQQSGPGPDALGSLAGQHKGFSPNMDPSLKQGRAALGMLTCPRKSVPLDGSRNWHSTSLPVKWSEASLHSNPSRWLSLGEQQDLASMPNKGRPGGQCPTNSLASSQRPRLGSSTCHCEFPTMAGAARCALGLRGDEKEQPKKCRVLFLQEVPSANRLPPRHDAHWAIKRDQISQDAFLGSKLSPQGISKPMDSLELEPSQGNGLRLTSPQPGNRGTGACIVSKQVILERPPPATLLSGKLVSEQDKTLALQPAKQLQERTPLPCQVAVRPRARIGSKGLGSQTQPFRTNMASESCPEARVGSQGAKAFLTGDKKRYFEFHLREMLLHRRWGIPRMVLQSMAKAARLTDGIK
ncbi:uncharacterized protein LOC143833647 [Paroedura picta]|uniref:uncharacterized protein LOC143833647 n=1 Tax=Paroedura picta TaxID=143630 RepID=UPI004056D3C4